MSRSYHQKHPTKRSLKSRFPDPFRKRKRIAYGSKLNSSESRTNLDFWYKKKLIVVNEVNKKWARQSSKKIICRELKEYA